MLCLGCIQVPGKEAEEENEEEEEEKEEGSLMSEQGPQNQDVRTFLHEAVQVISSLVWVEQHATSVVYS